MENNKLKIKLTQLLGEEKNYNDLLEEKKEIEERSKLLDERITAKHKDIEELRKAVVEYNIMEYVFNEL